ncbi:hypothetical protein BHE74_00022768 [Ensete ventricosum]|nr:hypothetical protein BHE74_00022768 [Ensete ventricosum]RZS02082.1 hypothetical protein BHM03_00032053 [Ensete ventricosum]
MFHARSGPYLVLRSLSVKQHIEVGFVFSRVALLDKLYVGAGFEVSIRFNDLSDQVLRRIPIRCLRLFPHGSLRRLAKVIT